MAEKKRFRADALAFSSNIGSSVMLIYSNKFLMSSTVGYGFRFATTLCALHYLTCSAGTSLLRKAGHIQASRISSKDLMIFTLIANISIVSLNLSLMLNPVGYYQISKLCIIPCTCFVEAFWLKRTFTRPVIASVLMVLLGVAIVTVTDLGTSSNLLGFCIALLSVLSSTMQQVFCRTMQQRNGLGFLEFLSHTATAQGWTLIIVAPFVDHWIGGKWLLDYRLSAGAALALAVSCTVAIGVNMSQFACLGRFQAVTFQVLGHAKTMLVLLGGWLFFGDRVSSVQLFGIVVAVAGMLLYGMCTRRAEILAAKKESVDPFQASDLQAKGKGQENHRVAVNTATSQRRGPALKLANNV